MIAHYFPFKLRKITFGLGLLEISWMTSRYLICIAAFESSSYDAYFIIFAASTSALAEMMVASANRFCLATEDRFD